MTPKEFLELHDQQIQKDLENIKKRKDKALPNLSKAIEDVNRLISYQVRSNVVHLSFNSSYLELHDNVIVNELALLLKKYYKDKGWLVLYKTNDYIHYLSLYPNTFINKCKIFFYS